jgi:hypothetical protein
MMFQFPRFTWFDNPEFHFLDSDLLECLTAERKNLLEHTSNGETAVLFVLDK